MNNSFIQDNTSDNIADNAANDATLETQSIFCWLNKLKNKDSQIAITYKDVQSQNWLEVSAIDYLKRITYLSQLLNKALKNKTASKIALMSQTRWEWAAIDVAAIGCGHLLIPLYPNQSNEDVEFILKDSAPDLIIVENEKLNTQVVQIVGKGRKKNIVIDDFFNDDFYSASAEITDAEIDAFLKQCQEIKPEDNITLIYTSGTTGQPRGVLMQAQALISEVSESFFLFNVNEKDTSLSFLPYAHVLGRIEHWGSYCMGYKLAFAQSVDTLKKDLQHIRPQFLIAVPRIFEKIYASVLNQLETNPIKKKLFTEAQEVAKKIVYYRKTTQTPPLSLLAQYEFYSALVFKPIKKAFGGELRFCISGGAPLHSELIHFFSNIGISIYEGYGLTETFAAVTVNTQTQWEIGTVGRPIGDVKIRLADDGEILIKSKKLMRGYFNNPEATKNAFSDGYFKTGDIGEWSARGFLKVTDRKKDLIKTAGGKYVAPQKLEGLLKEEPLISHVLIVGEQQKFISALISVESFSTSTGVISAVDLTDEQKKIIEDRLHKCILQMNSQLASYEAIKKFKIVYEPWNVENGCLTPSLKVKRKFLEQKYAELIESIYF